MRIAEDTDYRGRIAPTPTGYLHLGHARTFLTAQARAREASGALVLRIEDLDKARCKTEFREAVIEDLRWAGLDWDEGPDRAGPFAPYVQSDAMERFSSAWSTLREARAIYPCYCSRKDVRQAINAPHANDGEVIYPGTCRGNDLETAGQSVNWRFRVPDDESVSFLDGRLGSHSYVTGKDFGDFLVWRKDGLPSYELAVVADDAAMQITEVVRGEDLLLSTARQLLLYRSLGWPAPRFYHCPLVRDASGHRLAKRNASLSLRELRSRGVAPESLLEMAVG